MHILFVVPYTPNPIRVRSYNLIKALVTRGHRLTVATLWTSADEQQDLAELDALGVKVIARPLSRLQALGNCLRALPGGEPLQAHYCWQPGLAAQLVENGHNPTFDVIHVEHLRGAQYGLALKQRLPGAVPIVWDSVDCISYLFAQAARQSRSTFGRWMTRLELNRTRRYEGWLVAQFDRVLVTSKLDRVALDELYKAQIAPEMPSNSEPAARISVVPNGVDLAYFCPEGETRDPATLVFSGKMSYHANVTAVLHLVNDIMPHVWRERPDVNLWIVGKDPPREIQVLARLRLNSRYPCTVTGTVPDLRPYLRRATLAVVPILYGAGIQNKILEAMSCSTPVVATRQACLALEAKDNHHLRIADEAEDFAQIVVELLADPEKRIQLGKASRHFVEDHHNWQNAGKRLESIYRLAMETKKTASRQPPSNARRR